MTDYERENETLRRIARVFPSRTNATPDDDLAFVGDPPFSPPEVDEVHISVTFTWDLPEAERLAKAWAPIAPVRIGGPATGMRGDDFTPGLYLKRGYVITSRGCPNRCWFCSVPKREGGLRELPITEGWNVLDDNLLACSTGHINEVLFMLAKQPHPAEFTGGLEANLLTLSLARAIVDVRPAQCFFAYDTPDDWLPLRRAAEMMHDLDSRKAKWIGAYVLIGWPKDTMEAADKRLRAVVGLRVVPMPMLWMNDKGETDPDWRKFRHLWMVRRRRGFDRMLIEPSSNQAVMEFMGSL